MRPRRQQTPISVRSDRLAERLKRFAGTGRSQAEILEEAIERLPDPGGDDLEQRKAELARLVARLSRKGIPSMDEFDRREYDENGNPR